MMIGTAPLNGAGRHVIDFIPDTGTQGHYSGTMISSDWHTDLLMPMLFIYAVVSVLSVHHLRFIRQARALRAAF